MTHPIRDGGDWLTEISDERLRELLDTLIHCVRYSDRNPQDGYAKDEVMIARRVVIDEFSRRATAPSMAGTITDTQVHRMCGYLQERCNKCPREIDTAYGRGTQGCYAIALETLEKACDLLSPPSPPLRREKGE